MNIVLILLILNIVAISFTLGLVVGVRWMEKKYKTGRRS